MAVEKFSIQSAQFTTSFIHHPNEYIRVVFIGIGFLPILTLRIHLSVFGFQKTKQTDDLTQCYSCIITAW